MGKQSSNKKYSFKGQRIIGNEKSNHSKSKVSSESEGSTTDDMLSALESDVHVSSNNKINNLANLANLNNISSPSINQMDMPQMSMSEMNQMGMPGMGMPQMGMPGMGMPGMGMPGMGMPGMNQMMGASNVDSLLVNNLVPMNTSSMNLDAHALANPSQMASNLGSLAKLSNFNSHENFNMPQMSNQMNHMTNQMNQPLNNGLNLKNLAKLNI